MPETVLFDVKRCMLITSLDLNVISLAVCFWRKLLPWFEILQTAIYVQYCFGPQHCETYWPHPPSFWVNLCRMTDVLWHHMRISSSWNHKTNQYAGDQQIWRWDYTPRLIVLIYLSVPTRVDCIFQVVWLANLSALMREAYHLDDSACWTKEQSHNKL